MASAQQTLNYNYNNNTSSNAGDWFSDTFLGTNKQQNKANLAMLNEQNRFTEYMSNTAYQRGMADMVQAGINPMIMYAQNGGSAKASAPSSGSQPAGQFDRQGGLLGRATARYINQMADNLSGKTAIDLAKSIL